MRAQREQSEIENAIRGEYLVLKFINNPEICTSVLARSGLQDLTDMLVSLYCSDGSRIDLAVIEGDCCYYIGTPPKRTQRVIWRENEQIR